jgi:hypothetical protein
MDGHYRSGWRRPAKGNEIALYHALIMRYNRNEGKRFLSVPGDSPFSPPRQSPPRCSAPLQSRGHGPTSLLTLYELTPKPEDFDPKAHKDQIAILVLRLTPMLEQMVDLLVVDESGLQG